MIVTHVPLLALQREIYRVPRGMERFRNYLASMVKSDGSDLAVPPLVVINPMAREHVHEMLDRLLEMDADDEAARIVERVAPTLRADFPPVNASLVVADDARGGWTNRWAIEYAIRVGGFDRKRPWVTGVLWSGEPASIETVRETMLAALYRADDSLRLGPAGSLGELMKREGEILARSEYSRPMLDEEEAEYTREVIEPYLADIDMRTVVECLFGDDAARSLGFTPRGLSPWAGLSLAVAEARDRLGLG